MASSDGGAHDGSSVVTGRLTAWPDESASTKQVGDWLDVNLPYLMKTYGFIIRGETPPSLLKFSADVDDGFADLAPITTGAAGWTAQGIAEYNRKISQARVQRDLRAREQRPTHLPVPSIGCTRN